MSGALKSVGIVFLLMLAVSISTDVHPLLGLILSMALACISAYCLYRPLPYWGLDKTGRNIGILVFAGLIGALGSVGTWIESSRLQDLRASDPDRYLDEIKADKDLWLSELEKLDPDKFAFEQAQIAAAEEQARIDAERKAAVEAAAKQKAAEAKAALLAEEQRKSQQAEIEEYVSQLQRELDSIGNYDARKYTDSQLSLGITLGLFSVWAQMYEDGEKLDLGEDDEKVRANFKREISKLQKRAFPILRDAYGPIMRKELWEFDASARTFGPRFTTVEFVSAVFAANRNIKEIQSSVRDTLSRLRFKQARYKWYREDNQYTYYDMDALPDEYLVIWSGEGRYRVVQ